MRTRVVVIIHTTGEVLMKRWHEEYKVFYRQWKIHRKSHVDNNKDRGGQRNRIGVDPYVVDCACDDQVGRFRKKDAWDCGNPRCGICHQDKFPKRDLTDQERKSSMKLKESLKDLRDKE